MQRVPMDLSEAEALTRAGRSGRVASALLVELDRLRERAQAAEESAEMAAHDARWGGTMTDAPVPDEAAQIVRKAIGPVPYRGTDRAVVEALAAAGWLHNPAEVAALRAVAEVLDAWMNHGLAPASAVAQIWRAVNATLGALPAPRPVPPRQSPSGTSD